MCNFRSYVIVAILLSLTAPMTWRKSMSASAAELPPGSTTMSYGAFILTIRAERIKQPPKQDRTYSNPAAGVPVQYTLNLYYPRYIFSKNSSSINGYEMFSGSGTSWLFISQKPDPNAAEAVGCRWTAEGVLACRHNPIETVRTTVIATFTTTITHPAFVIGTVTPTVVVTSTTTVKGPAHRSDIGPDTVPLPPNCRDFQESLGCYLIYWLLTLYMFGGCQFALILFLRKAAKRDVTDEDLFGEITVAARNTVPSTLLLTLWKPLTTWVDSVMTNGGVPMVGKLLLLCTAAMTVLWAIQIYITGCLPIFNPGTIVASSIWHAWKTGDRSKLGDFFDSQSETETTQNITEVAEGKGETSEKEEEMSVSSRGITEEHQNDMEAWQMLIGADVELSDVDVT